MTEDDFWSLVEAARAEAAAASGGDPADRVVAAVTEALSARPVDEILAFDRIVSNLMDHSYRNDLWAAGYLINGGCSDDGFDYFRGWIMSQGRAAWERALAAPDSLADLFEPGDEGEVEAGDMLVVAALAYERATGDRDAFYPLAEAARDDRSTGPADDEGEDFDFEDDTELRRRLPRLWALFGDGARD